MSRKLPAQRFNGKIDECEVARLTYIEMYKYRSLISYVFLKAFITPERDLFALPVAFSKDMW